MDIEFTLWISSLVDVPSKTFSLKLFSKKNKKRQFFNQFIYFVTGIFRRTKSAYQIPTAGNMFIILTFTGLPIKDETVKTT